MTVHTIGGTLRSASFEERVSESCWAMQYAAWFCGWVTSCHMLVCVLQAASHFGLLCANNSLRQSAGAQMLLLEWVFLFHTMITPQHGRSFVVFSSFPAQVAFMIAVCPMFCWVQLCMLQPANPGMLS